MQINPNITPDILSDLQQSQSALDTALQQVATGLSVNVPSDNPTASAAMVQNTIETGDVDQYTQNVSSVLSTVESASSVLSNVVTALTQAVSLGTEGADGVNSTANRQEIATQVQGILSSVVSAANTSVGGSFLFGGTSTSTPYSTDSTTSTAGTAAAPLTATTALTGGSVTSITDGSTGKTFTYTVPAAGATITALQTAIAGAVTAGTLSAGTALSFNANGQAVISTTTAGDTLQVSTNDAVMGQFSYTYNGTNDVNSVAVGDQLSVQVNLPGSQIFSNSSNNILGSLSSLVTALQSGNSSDITTATAAVSSAISFIGQQQAFYSNAESQLNSQDTFLQQDTVTLASQATNLIGVNLATAATNLTQAETDNSAALAAVAKVMPNTLLNYLEPPT